MEPDPTAPLYLALSASNTGDAFVLSFLTLTSQSSCWIGGSNTYTTLLKVKVHLNLTFLPIFCRQLCHAKAHFITMITGKCPLFIALSDRDWFEKKMLSESGWSKAKLYVEKPQIRVISLNILFYARLHLYSIVYIPPRLALAGHMSGLVLMPKPFGCQFPHDVLAI